MRTEDLATDTAAAAQSLGYQFAVALAARDRAALLALLDDEVDFRGLTPRRFWEEHTSAALVDDVILGKWFEPHNVVERVEAVETGTVRDRCDLTYRFLVVKPAGRFVIEQHAFFDVTQGKISWLRILCSGFQPLPACP